MQSTGQGGGATFTVTLPCRQAHLRAPAASALASVPEDPRLRGHGDRKPAALTWRRAHPARGRRRRGARDTAEPRWRAPAPSLTMRTRRIGAMRVLGEHWPNVLLSDIAMPGEDGYELMRRVNGLRREHSEPLRSIALTAFARESDRALALSAGFDEHLSKPVGVNTLIEAVHARAARRRRPVGSDRPLNARMLGWCPPPDDPEAPFARTCTCSARCWATSSATREGAAVFETVERVRRLARSARQGQPDDFERLRADVLSRLSVDDALPVARAFAHFLTLANIAEQHHRIRRRRQYLPGSGRRRAAGFADGDTSAASWRRASVPDALVEAVGRLSIGLVLTAHPTEVSRRTILLKHNRLAAALAQRDRPDLTRARTRGRTGVASPRDPRAVGDRRGAARPALAPRRGALGPRGVRADAVGQPCLATCARWTGRCASRRRRALPTRSCRFGSGPGWAAIGTATRTSRRR